MTRGWFVNPVPGHSVCQRLEMAGAGIRDLELGTILV